MSYAPNSEKVQAFQAQIAAASLSARDKSDLAFDLLKVAARGDGDRNAALSRGLGELKETGDDVEEVKDEVKEEVEEKPRS